jgi:hypothetical protein
MALPRIDVPTFEVDLPLSKLKVTFRPFLVKEQKILLMANEASDKDTIIRAIKQVLQNCTISKIEIDKLPILDIEYYFLHLRARSIGEIVELKYKCENEVEGTVCGGNLDVEFNLLDVQLENIENYSDVVMINSDIGIKFKYPDFSLYSSIKEDIDLSDLFLDIIINSIDYIFEGDTLNYAHETPKEELVEFLDALTQEQFQKIEEHFKNLPVLKKEAKVNCKKCGYEHEIKVENIESFFV